MSSLRLLQLPIVMATIGQIQGLKQFPNQVMKYMSLPPGILRISRLQVSHHFI
jgi:hypothetical protein